MRELPELIAALNFRPAVEHVSVCGDSDAVLETWAELARIVNDDELNLGFMGDHEFVTGLVWPNNEDEQFSLLVFLHYSLDSNICVRIENMLDLNIWVILTAFCTPALAESIINQANHQLALFLEPWQYSLRMTPELAVFESNL